MDRRKRMHETADSVRAAGVGAARFVQRPLQRMFGWSGALGARTLRFIAGLLMPSRTAAHVARNAETTMRQRAMLFPSGSVFFQPASGSLAPARARRTEHTGAFLTATYSNRAGSRTYKLYIPSSYYGQALPLIVMLHGCKQTPDDFAAGTRMNALADEFACFVAYPAQDFRANGSRCWNWFEAAHQLRGQGEPSIIAGITRAVLRAYPVDARRVYVAGLSAGGAMAAVMGATYPDLYAAIGIHSGLPYAVAHDLPSALELMKQGRLALALRRGDNAPARKHRLVPTIVFHGDQDTTVHPRNGDHSATHYAGTLADAQLDARAIVERDRVRDGHAYTRAVYHDGRRRAILEQWQIHGAGHAWSGGSARGSYTDTKGPDAAAEMMRFFRDHPRRRGRALLRWWR